jgi:uncharacterized MAPEG superfamily protein
LFVAALLLVHQTGHPGTTTDIGAALPFWARVAYVILYALGVPIIRLLMWNIAIIAIPAVEWQAFAG